jgi:hypothetical protein
MSGNAGRASRLARSLWLVWPLLAPLPMARGEQATSTPSPPAAGPARVVIEPPQEPYQDHYIAGGTLAPDMSVTDGVTDANGLARSIRVDGVVSVLSDSGAGAPNRVNENGIVASAQWDTAAYGSWSANVAARVDGSNTAGLGDGHGAASLIAHGVPFDGGWSADAGLGDLNLPEIGLARMQPRFLLPAGPMQGLSTELHGPSGLDLIAGVGEPGIFEGIKVPTFDTIGGTTATVGAQWRTAPNWTVGGALAQAHDVNLFANTFTPSIDRVSSTTGYLSTAWQSSSARAQFNFIDGSMTGSGNEFGSWVDATTTTGRITQDFGAFYIDPNLSWGNQLINSDLEGGYYRFGYQARRWFADVGIDQTWSVSGLGPDTTFLTSDGRYQLSRDLGVGGVVNLRRADGSFAWSVQGYVDNRNRWGIGRAQADYAHADSGNDASVTLNEGWNMPTGARLNTSVGYERLTTTALSPVPQTSTAAYLAVNGGGDLSSKFSIDANVRWGIALSGPIAPAVAANVDLTYQLSREWSLLLSYYENHTGSWQSVLVTSPLAPPVVIANPAFSQHGFFLTVRYQKAAGSHFAPLGGRPGEGAGRLTGTVYLDANDNGRFDAGEAVAPNVVVMLDGRYSTRTDSAGRFEFPAVATGSHIVTVVPDNLPLPWTVAGDGRVQVEVRTRDHTDVSIGARRIDRF